MAGMRDIRAAVARYYDLNPNVPSDVAFYSALVSSPDASVLELGCGTGRVLLPLAERCAYIQGIDLSEAMLRICNHKLRRARIPTMRAQVALGDISDFDLGRSFDLIIAPYRVMQNLESDSQLQGLFNTLHRHLSPRGTCVLNVFKPKWDAERMRREWVTKDERFCWEVPVVGGRVTCHDLRSQIDGDRLVLYPELIWRRYRGSTIVDDVAMKIPMRCYYPEGFTQLITNNGFEIIDRWGGYAGEIYGAGPELVVQFRHPA